MRRRGSGGHGQRRRGWFLYGCVGCGCVVPFVFAVACVCLIAARNRPIRIAVPRSPMPRNNAFDDFARASLMLRKIRHLAPAAMYSPPDTRAGWAKACADCAGDAAPALAVIRKALDKECRHPAIRSRFTPFPSSEFLTASRTIACVAEHYADTGRPAEAARTILDGVEMTVMWPRGGPCEVRDRARLCEWVVLRRFEPLLPQLSASELAVVAERLDRIANKRVPFSENVLEEKWLHAASVQELINSPQYRSIQDYVSGSQVSGFTLADGSDRPAVSQAARYILGDKETMLRDNMRYFDAVAEESRRPYVGESRVRPPQNALAVSFGIDYTAECRIRALACDAVLEILRCEVALLRYNRAHGRFPATLSGLVPAYLTTVPDDPFGGASGAKLRYIPEEAGRSFMLYSLGRDLRDDRATPSKGPEYAGGDIVAGRLFKLSRKLK